MKSIKKQTMKILFILLAIICIASNVYAVQITKEEYSKEYQEYLDLKDEEKEKVLEPRKFNIEVEQSYSEYLKNINNKLRVTQLLKASTLDGYDLREVIAENVKVRDQMQTNMCWAFATIGALESNLALKNKNNNQEVEVYDFSERHMAYASTRAAFENSQINEKGYNMSVSDGGNFSMAQAYLTNGSGAVTESQMVFENNEELIDISLINKTVSTELVDTVEFPVPSSSEKAEVIAQMKSHIANYGGIYAGVHGANLTSDYYYNATGALYCNNSVFASMDHAVLIVGWDDGYEKENFNPDFQPENDGAWIIKNSWGESITESLSEFKQGLYESNTSYCNSQGWNSARRNSKYKGYRSLC